MTRLYRLIDALFNTALTPIPCEEYTEAAPVIWPIFWRSEYDGRTVRFEAPSHLLF